MSYTGSNLHRLYPTTKDHYEGVSRGDMLAMQIYSFLIADRVNKVGVNLSDTSLKELASLSIKASNNFFNIRDHDN